MFFVKLVNKLLSEHPDRRLQLELLIWRDHDLSGLSRARMTLNLKLAQPEALALRKSDARFS